MGSSKAPHLRTGLQALCTVLSVFTHFPSALPGHHSTRCSCSLLQQLSSPSSIRSKRGVERQSPEKTEPWRGGLGSPGLRPGSDRGWRLRIWWHCMTPLVLKTVSGQFLNRRGSLLFVEKNRTLLTWDLKASLLQWWGQWRISTLVYFCQILIWRSNSDKAKRCGEN